MSHNNFSGKKILFFSVQTFNLEKEIKSKLEKMGAEVMYFDERPANSILAKGIIRIKKSLYQNKIDQYYHRILEKVKNEHFDFLFVNKGEVVPEFFLEKFSQLKLILVSAVFFTLFNSIIAANEVYAHILSS